MLKLYSTVKERLRFLDANTGGGGGSGGSGDSSGQDNGEVAALDPKLFDGIPMDSLDDDTREILTKIKTGAIATLQKAQTLEQTAERERAEARKFQSAYDRSQAELAKLNPANHQQPTDPIADSVRQSLKEAGYDDANIEKLAPVFAHMFKKVGAVQRAQLGDELKPLATTVLANQATQAFQAAQTQDSIGLFSIPEVQQKVWDIVKDRAEKGMENTPEIILNFAKMVWVDHQAAGGKNQQQLQLPANPPMVTTGGFTFPGQTPARSTVQPTPPANAPKTELNLDTANALAKSFGSMLAGFDGKIAPPSGLKDFLTPVKKTRRV